MRLPQDRNTRIKSWIYIVASLILSITWILSLAILTQKGGTDGRTAWVFGLCFLTIPLVVYASMTPLWTRAARFYNPYALAFTDAILAILWLSAWAALASYLSSGKGQGRGCEDFEFGTAAKCHLAEANTLFGVLLMLAFCATAFFSTQVVMEYKRTGLLPNRPVGKMDISYPVKRFGEEDAFDSNIDMAESRGREGWQSFEAQRNQGGHSGMPQPYMVNPGSVNEYKTFYDNAGGLADGRQTPVTTDGPLNRF